MSARFTCFSFLAACATAFISAQASAETIKLNPQATYLRQSSSDTPTTSATPIVLADIGVITGDRLLFEVVGDFTFQLPVNEGATSSRTIAIFSGSDSILASNLVERIPDAIDAGEDFVTAPTHFDGLTTDIPEDFLIPGSVEVIVPAGATHLFVAAHDSHYIDNRDLDNDGAGDYAVRLTVLPPVIPLPAAVWGGLALCGIIAMRRAIRVQKPLR